MNQPFTSFKEFKQRYPIRPNDEGSLLGIGSYGRVMKVEDQLETEWVAIKISEFKGNDTKSLKAEVELAQRVPRQANIARYDACYRFETDTSVSDFAIMKYYPDGNLADLLRRVILTPTQIYDITQGILLGLQHLHRNRIVHRDFKPANILISRDNAGRLIPKIADFGLSKLVSDDELDSSDFDLSDGRGTPSYKAPEQIEGSRVSFNLDLWAFGVILYEIMTGEKPFRANPQNSSEQSVRREIEKKIISVDLPARLDQVNEPYRTMIRRCLIRDIHERVRKENELLDLLDCIPQLLIDARKSVNNQHYKEAIALFEQVLAKREQHAEALQGVDFCIQALKEQHLANLLQEADDLVEKKRFEQAKERYEQVLKINPAHEKALQKLAFCINGLQPEPLVNEPEITDVYQTEQTDVYVAPSAPIAAKSAPVPTPPVLAKPASNLINKSAASPKPLIAPVIKPNIGWKFPWKTVGPAVLVLGGLIWRFYPTPVEKPPQITTADPVQTANIVPTKDNANDLSPKIPEAAKLKVVPGESKEALNKRIDVALGKAHQAYRQKNYAFTVDMANSALLLDPTRRDLVALRTAAMKEMQTRGQDAAKTEVPAVPTPEAQKSTSPEAEKPRATEPAVPESSKTAKQEAQETYEQLIEEGIKAIANGNNKAKAIGTFTKAQGLANDQDLSTTKADAAYAVYMTKANKIFATDEFDGAKEWYQVARSLKDTEEVRRKIKQCTNQ